MKAIYIKEQRRYTFTELKKLMDLTNDNCEKIIKKLKYFGILRIVRATSEEKKLADLQNEIEILEDKIDSISIYYVFKYVGIITIGDRVLICYPKYINRTNEPKYEMKQILKVIKKYNSEEQIINMYNGEGEERSFNLLSIILFLINDYYINDVYTNHKDIIEIKGEGDILWDKTINETFALINNNNPYYLEVYTEKSVEDNMNYFNRLHKYIITECFKYIEASNLGYLFDIEVNELYDGNIDDFGDEEYILYRLDREINTQYITKKQITLKTIYAYIANRKVDINDLGLSLYGTTNFNLIWEKVCANALNNKINCKLHKLPLKLSLEYEDKKQITLRDIIEKPKWKTINKNGKIISLDASKTLTPDLISIIEYDNTYGFMIFDAKYYTISFDNNKLCNNPGIGDVTKEYLYQLAYSKFIKSNGYKFIANSFLFPTEGNDTKSIGEAEMSILADLGLSNIELIKLPATKVYDLYLNNKLFDINIILRQINLRRMKACLEKDLFKDIYEIVEKQVIHERIKANVNETVYDGYLDIKYELNTLSNNIGRIIRSQQSNYSNKIKEIESILRNNTLIKDIQGNKLIIEKIEEIVIEKFLNFYEKT